ncbi:peptide-methionine (S)-S-oxide reductase MsrA [Thorsellia kenyensis]|uniref:Peptide methionine sulfoxide reductase MsrA n=1 Tax=Thorsellia kenyensis TaxID=1549888 RepID=A0ABV6C7X6_9GAMM
MIQRDNYIFNVPRLNLITQKDMHILPEGAMMATFGMGCFWGVERLFSKIPGVINTSVGYCGGILPFPTYEEVCQGKTLHAEVVRVFYSPSEVTFKTLLSAFWENHNPTQGMRQGNDIGTQYRSVIFCHDNAQFTEAIASKEIYQEKLNESRIETPITTEINSALDHVYYFAEDYHQQYLFKNPDGYCGLGGTGVCFI